MTPPTERVSGVNRQIAARLRRARLSAGMSVRDLAAAIGASPERYRAYESEAARIPAGELKAAADALGLPLAAFFRDLTADPAPSGPVSDPGALAGSIVMRDLPASLKASLRDLVDALVPANKRPGLGPSGRDDEDEDDEGSSR